MIKVYINNEYIISFKNQLELDNWLQSCDANDLNNVDIEIDYSEDEI